MNIVRELRKKAGINQKELAMAIGVSEPTVSEWENGRKNPTKERLRKLAEFFGVDELVVLGRGVVDLSDDPETLHWIQNERILTEREPPAPDYEKAAYKAVEALMRYGVNYAPILPMTILKAIPGVFVVPFTELASNEGLDRDDMGTLYGAQNQDVVTFKRERNGRTTYVVAYNQMLPFYLIQVSMARELGHILLEHTAALPKDTRLEEAMCFARHLLCPRPLVRLLQESNVDLTVKTFGNITGCYGRFLTGIRKTPGVIVSPSLNRIVKEQFVPYVSRFLEIKDMIASDDDTIKVDFGSYMDNYEESL